MTFMLSEYITKNSIFSRCYTYIIHYFHFCPGLFEVAALMQSELTVSTLMNLFQVYKQSKLICRMQKHIFNLCVMQAEAWIKSKLWDLKVRGNIQQCPVQGWDETLQILCADLKDFENVMVQLNQVRQGFTSEMGVRVSTFQCNSLLHSK